MAITSLQPGPMAKCGPVDTVADLLRQWNLRPLLAASLHESNKPLISRPFPPATIRQVSCPQGKISSAIIPRNVDAGRIE